MKIVLETKECLKFEFRPWASAVMALGFFFLFTWGALRADLESDFLRFLTVLLAVIFAGSFWAAAQRTAVTLDRRADCLTISRTTIFGSSTQHYALSDVKGLNLSVLPANDGPNSAMPYFEIETEGRSIHVPVTRTYLWFQIDPRPKLNQVSEWLARDGSQAT